MGGAAGAPVGLIVRSASACTIGDAVRTRRQNDDDTLVRLCYTLSLTVRFVVLFVRDAGQRVF
jgi:hypothetical protein